MSIQTVKYLHQSAAERLQPDSATAMISITDPIEDPADLHPGWTTLLRCRFVDSEYDERDISFWKEKWNLVSNGRPKAEHAIEILGFLEKISRDDAIKHLVVHCHAGRSRSAAVAKYVAQRYGLPFDHTYGAYNKTVYELLQDPERYRHFEMEVTQPVKRAERSMFGKVAEWFGL